MTERNWKCCTFICLYIFPLLPMQSAFPVLNRLPIKVFSSATCFPSKLFFKRKNDTNARTGHGKVHMFFLNTGGLRSSVICRFACSPWRDNKYSNLPLCQDRSPLLQPWTSSEVFDTSQLTKEIKHAHMQQLCEDLQASASRSPVPVCCIDLHRSEDDRMHVESHRRAAFDMFNMFKLCSSIPGCAILFHLATLLRWLICRYKHWRSPPVQL